MSTRSDFSIIICTRNRAESLRQTLAAVAQLEIPEYWTGELLVVDNGSTDRTREVVESCQIAVVPVRYIWEARVGKSHAYNTGLKEARGEILLFLDDDVWPPHDWVERMCAPISAGKADAVAGGIKLAACLERPWMEASHYTIFAVTEILEKAGPLQLIGANMALAHSVLAHVPAFDPELGPGRLGLQEDSLYSWQLERAGFKLAAVFEAVSEHHVEESRLRRAAWLEHARKQQRSWAYVLHHWKHEVVSHPRRQLWWYRCYLAYMRLRHLTDWLGRREGAAEWEMSLVGGVSFFQQYLLERKRPRNYEQFGLMKLRGELESDGA